MTIHTRLALPGSGTAVEMHPGRSPPPHSPTIGRSANATRYTQLHFRPCPLHNIIGRVDQAVEVVVAEGCRHRVAAAELRAVGVDEDRRVKPRRRRRRR